MQQAEDAEAAPPGAAPERAPDLASVLEGLEDPDAQAAGEAAAQQLGDDGEEPVLALPPPEAGARSLTHGTHDTMQRNPLSDAGAHGRLLPGFAGVTATLCDALDCRSCAAADGAAAPKRAAAKAAPATRQQPKRKPQQQKAAPDTLAPTAAAAEPVKVRALTPPCSDMLDACHAAILSSINVCAQAAGRGPKRRKSQPSPAAMPETAPAAVPAQLAGAPEAPAGRKGSQRQGVCPEANA